MTAEKHDWLVAGGKVRADGSRIEQCPVCGQELPEHLTTADLATAEHVVATPAPVVLTGESP